MNTDRNAWFKSSYSPANGDCVEIKVVDPTSIGIRDSTDPAGARLHIRTDVWTSFSRAVASGQFQREAP
ncbi:DUF397 domain-containing protein [Streptomyces sp. B6B3]|uniref:DUF397 domain-containing protein n=1 Tax=Streptomyces sp. B6B3 TaxID=3153570 RepID=UPI00325F78AD